MLNRQELGAKKVGEPIWDLRHAANILAQVEFEHVRMDAIDYYIETYLMKFLPQIADDALSDEQLVVLDPDVVKKVAFLLIGDAIVKLRHQLVRGEQQQLDPQWHVTLIRRIAKLVQLDEEPFVVHVLSDKQATPESDPLLTELSQAFGVEVAKFFILQPAMIEVVVEEILDK